MFGSRRKTVIAKGLKIEGRVTAEGLVELNGQIEGELHGKSLIISRGALVKGAVSAHQVVVDGTIEGPIRGGEIILKSRAHVIGDIHHQSLSIETGASFEGRSVQTGRARGSLSQPDDADSQPARSLERRLGRTAMATRVPAERGRHPRQFRRLCAPEPSLKPAASRLWPRGRVAGCE
jgi:cytoskeletal protein CcmA (bactofilin family)